MSRLEDYRDIVGADTLEEIKLLGRHLQGKTVLHVNSTAVGGGVAEILNQLVPMFNELGLKTDWQVIKGGEDFYAVTKRFHNALHGNPVEILPEEYRLYEDTLEENMSGMNLDYDFVFIHDPQPAGLIKKKNKKGRWVWRCHIDLSRPDPSVWDFLKNYVEKYDACIFSAPGFARNLQIPQALISPSIDPLSDKNRELGEEEINSILNRLKIPRDKPLVTQVSRFDRLKDPLGVIKVFLMVKPYIDARLLLVGGAADDDPEGTIVLKEVTEAAMQNPDIMALCLPSTSNIEINAIQKASTVILQKSLREGFGLTVAEGLWKSKPVIASAVGGIPLQITHKHSGILTHSIEGTAYWLKQLLNEPGYAAKLGLNGREHIRQNFLITRHLRDYLLLCIAMDNPGQEMIRL